MIDVYRVSWAEVMQSVNNLARRLPGKKIWGLKRGGLIVAALMTYRGCELVAHHDNADVVIDDIADTGRTLGRRRQTTAVLIVRHGCDPLPDFWSMMIATKDYILFPWEDEKEAFEYMRKRSANEKQE